MISNRLIGAGGVRFPGTITSTAPATPAAPSAAAAPQYSVSNLPPDASYDAQIAALQKQRDQQIAQIAQARSSSLLDYGFSEGANGTLSVDPNNPYSKAALLKKSYDQNRRSTGQSLASGGQLYNGAYQNAQDLVNRNEAQSSDSLQKSLINFLVRNTQSKLAAGTNFETAAQQAAGDRIGRFQSNPLYDPSASQQNAPGAAGGASAAASGAPSARSGGGGGSSFISGYQNIPKFKTVGGKIYRMTASGKWMPVS